MPAKKKRPAGPDTPDDSTAWRVILERIEAQNHTTLEAVHTSHHRLADQMREFKEEVNARFETLETVVRGHSADIRGLKADVGRVETKVDKLDGDVADLKTGLTRVETRVERVEARVERIETKVDKLVPLEERVAALERRGA